MWDLHGQLVLPEAELMLFLMPVVLMDLQVFWGGWGGAIPMFKAKDPRPAIGRAWLLVERTG